MGAGIASESGFHVLCGPHRGQPRCQCCWPQRLRRLQSLKRVQHNNRCLCWGRAGHAWHGERVPLHRAWGREVHWPPPRHPECRLVCRAGGVRAGLFRNLAGFVDDTGGAGEQPALLEEPVQRRGPPDVCVDEGLLGKDWHRIVKFEKPSSTRSSTGAVAHTAHRIMTVTAA